MTYNSLFLIKINISNDFFLNCFFIVFFYNFIIGLHTLFLSVKRFFTSSLSYASIISLFNLFFSSFLNSPVISFSNLFSSILFYFCVTSLRSHLLRISFILSSFGSLLFFILWDYISLENFLRYSLGNFFFMTYSLFL